MRSVFYECYLTIVIVHCVSTKRVLPNFDNDFVKS